MSKKKLYDVRPVEAQIIREEIQQERQTKEAINQAKKRKQLAAR